MPMLQEQETPLTIVIVLMYTGITHTPLKHHYYKYCNVHVFYIYSPDIYN